MPGAKLLAATAVVALLAACSSTVEGAPKEGVILTARTPVELRVVSEVVPGPSSSTGAQPAYPERPTPSATPGQTVLHDQKGAQYYVVGPVELTLGRFKRVDTVADPTSSGFAVELQLADDDAAKFFELTGKNVNKQVAVVIDGKVVMAPSINNAITGGTVQIVGGFTKPEAEELARQLSGR
jgi:preprotein translocase subunit SecD